MATVYLYRWDDANAPALTGAAGSLVDLLDACLVNGYTGRTAAGWSIAHTGTNKRAYRFGTGAYYQFIDDGTVNSTSKLSGFRGYLDMPTDVDSGTDPFPTITNRPISVMQKSFTTDASERPWIIVASAGMVYVSTQPYLAYEAFFLFGEFNSYKVGDTDNYLCHSSGAHNYSSSASTLKAYDLYSGVSNVESTVAVPWIPLDASGLGTAVTALIHAPGIGRAANAFQLNSLGMTYPDPITGAFNLYDGVKIFHRPYNSNAPTDAGFRGELRGLSYSNHDLVGSAWAGVFGDTFFNETGTREYIQLGHSGGSTVVPLFIQLTDPWV